MSANIVHPITGGETTNLLKQGALYINNDKIDAEDSLNVEKHILNGNVSIIRRGTMAYLKLILV